MALQDLQNNIKAGKKIFEIFEKAEQAINEILTNQAQYDELGVAIEQRKKEFESLTNKAIVINNQLEAALKEGRDNIDATNAKCKEIESEAKEKAARIISDAEDSAKSIAFSVSTAEFKLGEKNRELKSVEDKLTAKQKELGEVNAKIDAAKQAMANAIQGL